MWRCYLVSPSFCNDAPSLEGRTILDGLSSVPLDSRQLRLHCHELAPELLHHLRCRSVPLILLLHHLRCGSVLLVLLLLRQQFSLCRLPRIRTGKRAIHRLVAVTFQCR